MLHLNEIGQFFERTLNSIVAAAERIGPAWTVAFVTILLAFAGYALWSIENWALELIRLLVVLPALGLLRYLLFVGRRNDDGALLVYGIRQAVVCN